MKIAVIAVMVVTLFFDAMANMGIFKLFMNEGYKASLCVLAIANVVNMCAVTMIIAEVAG